MSLGMSYYTYQHCYYEGHGCIEKELSCTESLVISVEWARIWQSEYLDLDPQRQNCTNTDPSCYESVQEPVDMCEGLPSCSLDTCSNFTHQQIPCTVVEATNALGIKYTCVESKNIVY